MNLRSRGSRAVFGLLSALLLSSCTISSCAKSGPNSLSGRASGMNVVLVIADTLRADHLSTYGYAKSTSPSLTKLAEHGALFEHAYVQCNFSGGSYASIFTGLYAHHHGVRNHPMTLDDHLVTLAEVLKKDGYTTFGRHSHPLLQDQWRYRQGFDDYGARGSGEESARDVVDFLDGVGDDRFFVFVQLMEPHYPYSPPAKYMDRTVRQPAGFEARVAKAATNKSRLMFGYEQLPFRPEDFGFFVSLYDGEICYADFILGRIVKSLDKQGLRENTLIVFIADHGEALGEHGVTFNHDATLYDPVMRVPFLLSNERLFPSPLRISQQVREIDLFDTVLDLVGIESPGNDGASVLSLLDGSVEKRFSFAEGRPLDPSRARVREEALRQGFADPIPHYRVTVAGIEGKWRSVRGVTHKLIFVPGEDRDTLELYDIENDSGETSNLITSPDHRAMADELRAELDRWTREDPGAKGRVEMSRDVFEELKALGYVEGEFSKKKAKNSRSAEEEGGK